MGSIDPEFAIGSNENYIFHFCWYRYTIQLFKVIFLVRNIIFTTRDGLDYVLWTISTFLVLSHLFDFPPCLEFIFAHLLCVQ